MSVSTSGYKPLQKIINRHEYGRDHVPFNKVFNAYIGGFLDILPLELWELTFSHAECFHYDKTGSLEVDALIHACIPTRDLAIRKSEYYDYNTERIVHSAIHDGPNKKHEIIEYYIRMREYQYDTLYLYIVGNKLCTMFANDNREINHIVIKSYSKLSCSSIEQLFCYEIDLVQIIPRVKSLKIKSCENCDMVLDVLNHATNIEMLELRLDYTQQTVIEDKFYVSKYYMMNNIFNKIAVKKLKKMVLINDSADIISPESQEYYEQLCGQRIFEYSPYSSQIEEIDELSVITLIDGFMVQSYGANILYFQVAQRVNKLTVKYDDRCNYGEEFDYPFLLPSRELQPYSQTIVELDLFGTNLQYILEGRWDNLRILRLCEFDTSIQSSDTQPYMPQLDTASIIPLQNMYCYNEEDKEEFKENTHKMLKKFVNLPRKNLMLCAEHWWDKTIEEMIDTRSARDRIIITHNLKGKYFANIVDVRQTYQLHDEEDTILVADIQHAEHIWRLGSHSFCERYHLEKLREYLSSQ